MRAFRHANLSRLPSIPDGNSRVPWYLVPSFSPAAGGAALALNSGVTQWRSAAPLLKNIPFLVVALLCATPLIAQDRPPPSSSPTSGGDAGQWEPLGPIPVDQAGAGRRGYVLPGESASVTAPGADQVSFHTVAANTFFREETKAFLITQRYEAHTVALGYRRGFKVGNFPRFELGGQVQFHQSDNGFLNGFISSFEGAFASVTAGRPSTSSGSARRRLRRLAPS